MRLIVIALLTSAALFAQGSASITSSKPPSAAVLGSGLATAGSGTASVVSCTLTPDAVPVSVVNIACTLGTGGAKMSTQIPATPGMTWTLSPGLNGNVVSIVLTQPAAGGLVTVTMTSTVNGVQQGTQTGTF